MKEFLQSLISLLAIGVFGVMFVSAFINIWWALQFAVVKRQVISELKPFRPSIEAELSFAKNQNALIPPLLKALTESHESSTLLSEKTRNDLTYCVKKLLIGYKVFFLFWAVGVGIVIFGIVAQIALGQP